MARRRRCGRRRRGDRGSRLRGSRAGSEASAGAGLVGHTVRYSQRSRGTAYTGGRAAHQRRRRRRPDPGAGRDPHAPISIAPKTGRTRRVRDLPRAGRNCRRRATQDAAFDRPPQVSGRLGNRGAACSFAGVRGPRPGGSMSGSAASGSPSDRPTRRSLIISCGSTVRRWRRSCAYRCRTRRDARTGGGSLWVASRSIQTVVAVDPETGAVLEESESATSPRRSRSAGGRCGRPATTTR